MTPQATHELSNKQQLYSHLVRAPEGTYSTALTDAYPDVAADIAALRAEGLIWALPSVDTGGGDVLYPREERPLIQVSPDVAALWHEVSVREIDRDWSHLIAYAHPKITPGLEMGAVHCKWLAAVVSKGAASSGAGRP